MEAAIDQGDDDLLVSVSKVSKCYHLYGRPQDRLWQALWRGRRQYYREFWALRDVSLEVRRGETIGIIGRNGAGKSTLLQLIAGTLTPTSGSVAVRGRVAALLQLGSGFNPSFTGRENVYLNGAILGFSSVQIDERFDAIAAFADIGDFIDQPVKTYSSGMMVRLAFAVSTCLEPEVLIVDEALAVGDAAFQFKCRNRLDQLVEQGTTLLFVSHDITMVKSMCHRALYLAAGMERGQGSPNELADLYLMDLRDEQAASGTAATRVVAKERLPGREGLSFGTADGHIVAATFDANGGSEASFLSSEAVDITLIVEYSGTVLHPAVSVIIQSANLLNLGGRYHFLPAGGEGLQRRRIRCRLPARFAPGYYHVSVRLEDRYGSTEFFPLDRQAGLLTFQVASADEAPILPAVDLGMTLRVDELPTG
jgi:lipopolysaccharide transport system ATP-binding protein